jgi:hypothetical protein
VPDYAPNFTGRYIMNYSVLGRPHKQLWRVSETVTDVADVVEVVTHFWAALNSQTYANLLVVSAVFAPGNTDVFLPVTAPIIAPGLVSVPSNPQGVIPLALSFPGRSANGGRAILYTYGTGIDPSAADNIASNYRVTASEIEAVADAIDVLNAASGVLVANDRGPVAWYPYANVKDNDHWVRRVRNG